MSTQMVHMSETTVLYEYTDGIYIRNLRSLGAHWWYICQRQLFSRSTQMVHVLETTVLYEHADGTYIRDLCSLGEYRWYIYQKPLFLWAYRWCIYQRPLFSRSTQMVHMSETTVLYEYTDGTCIRDHCSGGTAKLLQYIMYWWPLFWKRAQQSCCKTCNGDLCSLGKGTTVDYYYM